MSDITFDIIGRDRASTAFRNVGKSAGQANKDVSGFSNTLKSHVSRFAALTAGSLGAGALIGFAKESINTEAQFSTSMRQIQASSGATRSQMAQLNKMAVDLGIKTVYSANEAAAAMLDLSKAGVATKDIMKGAAAGTLLLASAGGTDLTTAATIASNAMNAFNLKGRDMGKIAAALAGGANASSASVESLGYGLAQVGPGARNAGLSLQETVAALSAFDNAGIKGQDAGTSLKTMLTRLIPTTKKASLEMGHLGLFSEKTGSAFVNANGSFKNLTQISGILHDKLSKLTAAQRSTALSIIFGSDASRAATVLMNNGAKGISKYIKATNDQNAAQKMANATMSGTHGALEQLSGSIDTAKLRLGQALAPVVIKVSNYLAQHLVPAMDDTIGFAKDLGKTLNATVIPPLKFAGSIVLDVAKVFGNLPGPIKSVGIEAGIAALVFPRLTAGVASATTAIKDQITYARVLRLEMVEGIKTQGLMATATAKMGGALKMAAGVGGMVALTEASKTTNAGLKDTLNIAGKVSTGFAFGGPIGATLGLAASFKDLQRTFDRMLGNNSPGTLGHLISEGADAAAKASTAIQGYRRSLLTLQATIDTISGKKTADTRVKALTSFKSNYDQIYAQLKQAGVTDRALAFAVSGNKKATAMILKTLASKQGLPGVAASAQFAQAASAINDISLRTQVAVRNTRNQISVTRHLTGLYKVFPKKVVSELKINGIVPSLAGVKKVAEQYKVVGGKKLTALIKASGWEPTKKQVESLTKALQKVPDVKPDVSPFLASLGRGISNGKTGVTTSTRKLLTGATNAASGAAFRGGNGVGSDIGAGAISGLNSKSGPFATTAFSFVTQGIASMRKAAKSHSPSRETMKVGNDLGDGMRIGLRQRQGGVNSAGADLIESLVKGIDDHRVKLTVVMDKLTSYISKKKSDLAALVSKKNGILSSVQGFSSSVFGATFQDAQGNDRTGSVQDLIAFQQQQATQAAQLKDDIAALAKNHISKNLLNQLLNEGAAGIANIHTLAGASSSQIAQINSLNAQTQAAGSAGGNTIAGQFGINGHIAQDQADLRTAEAMAREFRKVLHEEKKDQHIYVYLNGKQIHTILLEEKSKQRKGLNLG